ncbi:MAG: WD40 repeat domain-containing protein, partial [Planctomycetales bacterium]|nr:WD40 repeat domain-containing protein [Planctomycetales bacterium]
MEKAKVVSQPAFIAAEAQPIAVLKGAWGLTDQMEFSANGKIMVSMAPHTGLSMQNKMVLSVWEMPTRRLVVSIPVPRAGTRLAVAADGNSFATIEVNQFGGFTEHACVYNAKTGRLICSIDAGARSLTGIAIAPDGSQVAIGTDESKDRPIGAVARFGQVALIDVPRKTNRGIVGGIPWSNAEFQRPPAVVALSYSPDGQRLAFGNLNNDVSVIDTKTLASLSSCKSRMPGLLLGHNRLRWSDQETFVVGTDLRRVNARTGESRPLFDPTVVLPDRFSNATHEPTHRVISTDLVAMSADRLVIGGARNWTTPNAIGDMIEKAEFRVIDLNANRVIRQ